MAHHDNEILRDGISRRGFFKGSAAVVGGVLLSNLPIESSAYAAGNDTIKIALIGCGGRGTGAAAQALSTKANVKLVAMADAFKDRLDESHKNLTEKFSQSKKVDVKNENKFVGFDGYKEAIKLADVVILATPPGFRPIHFSAAVDAGKHVFMEKPVATDGPGVRKVLEAAERAKQKNLKVVVGLQRRYQNSYRETIKRLQDGAIGDIVAARCFWNDGGVWVKERKPEMTEMEYQMRNWYYFNWLCGDHINEQHIHNIDVINWAKGGYPVSAQGMGGREVRNGKEFGEIFDHHFVEFEYADGTILSSQCRHQRGCMKKVEEFMIGTKGRANTEGNHKGVITDLKGNSIFRYRANEDEPDPYQQEHDELFAAIVNNTPLNDAEWAAKSTMTAIMGRMATYSGQVIKWEEALNSQIDLMPKEFTWNTKPLVLPDENGFYPVAVPGKTKAV